LRVPQPLIIVESSNDHRSVALFPVAEKREQQKLWLILFQIKAVRARLNSLAAQFFAFLTLAIIVAGAAIVLSAALLMPPLWFLATAVAVAIGAFIGVVRVTRAALRSSANPLRAAALADDRAGLKGRLMTVLLMAGKLDTSGLWPYLIEDTYGRRTEFEPSKIEPRWLSRSIVAFAAATIAALLLVRFARLRNGSHSLAMNALPGQVSADLGHLDIRPADPALEPNAEIYADEATMRKLADKLASAEADGKDKNGLSNWMNKARDLAGQLQNEITGNRDNRPPLRLRLTDKNPDSGSSSHSHSGNRDGSTQGDRAGGSGAANKSGDGTDVPGSSPSPNGQLAQNGPGFPGQAGKDAAMGNPSDLGPPMAGSAGNGGGASHGAGSDPEHLFGPPSSQPLGSDSFRITIDAQPSDESSTPGAPAYIPPKVRVPLNEKQSQDEPIARASVPAADQLAVKRVFER
jgi:hypothetical protein